MAEVVPAINVESFDEVLRRIKIAEKYARVVHIDVADGSFTPNTVWHNAQDLEHFETLLFIEIHFMVEGPEAKIAPWLATCAKRIIFHAEATDAGGALITKIHAAGKEAGVAIRPDTSWEKLLPYVGSADLLQALAVSPGPSGQQFNRAALDTLKNIRAKNPLCKLEIDGGIDVGIARECKDAGANFIVVGSQLFEPEDTFAAKFEALIHDISN